MLGVFFFFAVIGVPHRNNAAGFNAAGFAAWRPDQNHHPKIKQTDGDVSRFAIIPADIFNGDGDRSKDFARSGKVKTRFLQRFVALVLVEFYFHRIIVVTKNIKVNTGDDVGGGV
ncbi:hypothetical protein JCM39068_42500 [Desulfocastanea catecholica]